MSFESFSAIFWFYNNYIIYIIHVYIIVYIHIYYILELGDSASLNSLTIFSQNAIAIVKLSRYLVSPQPYVLYFINTSYCKILLRNR